MEGQKQVESIYYLVVYIKMTDTTIYIVIRSAKTYTLQHLSNKVGTSGNSKFSRQRWLSRGSLEASTLKRLCGQWTPSSVIKSSTEADSYALLTLSAASF